MEVELQSSHSLRATIRSLQFDLLSAKAERDRAISDKEKLSDERDQALSEKGAALTARDQAISKLERAIEEKKWAISLQDNAIEERREAVERIEELHLQVVELQRELSQVSELRDSSWGWATTGGSSITGVWPRMPRTSMSLSKTSTRALSRSRTLP